jgi:hypothetical protein
LPPSLEQSSSAVCGHLLPQIFYLDSEVADRDQWTIEQTSKTKRRILARMRVCGLRYRLIIKCDLNAYMAFGSVIRTMREREIRLAPFSTLWIDNVNHIVVSFLRKGDVVVFRLLLAEFGLPLK